MDSNKITILKNKGLNIARKIQKYITLLIVLTTIFAYLARHINPDTTNIPQYLGMFFPYLLFVDIIYTILLICFKQKLSLIMMIITILVGLRPIMSTIQINPVHFADDTKYSDIEDSSINIMTFNVRLLDKYNWIKSKSDTRQKIFEFLKYESPDIVCFQEFYARYSDSINNETIIQNMLDTKYVVRDYDPDEKWIHTDKGYLIFSKYKLSNKRYIVDSANNINGITVDADVYGKTIRIFNIHLKSIRLGYDDYNFIDSLNNKNNKEQFSGFQNIFRKVDNAYSERANQSIVIDSMIKASPYPVVVCGDFNDPPVSYTYNTVKGDLDDAFCESGFGFCTTMKLKCFRFRIDYILHSKEILSRGFKTHTEHLSDHFAVSCNIKLK